MLVATAASSPGPPSFLLEVVVLLAVAAGAAYLTQRLGLVSIVGFLLAGVLIGPDALGLLKTEATVDAAAEIGVLLLLFTIGIEFSLERLLAIRRVILLGGSLQVVLAVAATAGVLMVAGVSWQSGVYTGMLVALSSTAIVLALLAARGETGTRQGQVALGLLVFQDLAVIVMVLLVPALGGAGQSALGVAGSLAQAAAIIAVVLVVARRLMPPLLEAVARTCAPEVFLLTLVATALGTAYVTSLLDVSLSLGAFLAGLMVSESRFASHALGEILPLQILFSAVFFVSVGTLLDLGGVAENAALVAAGVLLVLVVKTLTTYIAVRALRLPGSVAVSAALLLAQVGEFSFVLERVGAGAGLTPAGAGAAGSQAFIAVTVLLMVVTPFLARAGAALAARPGPGGQRGGVDSAEPIALPLERSGHVVVAGFGGVARALVRGLEQQGVEYVVTTLSPEGAAEADDEGRPVLRGDYTKAHTLRAAGIERARVLVVADDRDEIAERVASVARSISADVRIVVRSTSGAADAMSSVGTDVVVTDERASAVALAVEVLQSGGASDFQVLAAVRGLTEPVGDAPVGPFGSGLVTLRPRGAGAQACGHLDGIRPVRPSAPGCEECLRAGDRWVHVRVCTTCGHAGCCDSSPGRHASTHWLATGHPVVASGEPGEQWGWCYSDEVRL